MKVSDFNYELPEELIAQVPIKDRSASRLMVLHRDNETIEHKTFKDIIDYLKPGDCLVRNNTKVIPARLYGVKEETGVQVEFLLLNRIEGKNTVEENKQNTEDKSMVEENRQNIENKNTVRENKQKVEEIKNDLKNVTGKNEEVWEVMVRPGRRLKEGTRVTFGDGLLKAEILETLEGGNRKVRFEYEGIFNEILDQIGLMPLPPYIHETLKEKGRYQTVYAKYEGSAAAPTAGLHFTDELLEQIKQKGVEIANVTLHVGIGTFRPVKVENIEDHHMHTEHFYIKEEDVEKINKTKQNGGRIIAVGTTSCRVLESIADAETGMVQATEGDTGIFIYPGYKFKCIDGLITNFHLPESTLIMLVSAFANRDFIMKAYNEAVKERYRFFSFGDAMLIT